MESFSQKIKSEILEMPIKSYKNVCQELSAIFTFSGNADNSNVISLPSKNTCTVARVLKLTEFALDFRNNESEFQTRILRYNLDFKLVEKIVQIPCKVTCFDAFDIKKLSTPAFLRGIFLVCGNVINPETEYHLEFCSTSESLNNILVKTLQSDKNLNFDPKTISRRNNYIVYSKNIEKITSFLVYIGAKKCAMDLMQVKMLKEVRNNINRTTNFETANISKIASSATDQITAIKKLKKAQKFEFLPNSLKKIANLRIENPYASLQDLADISDEKISKSGINHRLHKLLEISRELE